MMRVSNRLHHRTMRLDAGQRAKRAALLWTAAAAFSTSFPTTLAFVVSPNSSIRPRTTTTTASSLSSLSLLSPPVTIAPSSFPRNDQQTRLYARSSRNNDSNNNNNNDNGGGILGGLKKAAKAVLPSSWFQSEKEKQAAIERQRVKDDLQGGLQELFRDAPLPVRMVGKMMTPLVTNVMSGLAETMAEQQQSVQDVMRQAETYLQSDPAVASALGSSSNSSIQIGAPFSQSSSTTSINGQTTSQVQLQFPVQGSTGQSGVAQAVSANGQLQRLDLSVGGRTIPVSLVASSSSSSTFRRPRGTTTTSRNDDIIEAEIIEKDVKP